MRDPRRDFATLVDTRIDLIVTMLEADDIYYTVWNEVPGLDGDARYAVHAWSYAAFDVPHLLRSGEYRLTQIEALQLVVDLMKGVTV